MFIYLVGGQWAVVLGVLTVSRLLFTGDSVLFYNAKVDIFFV